MSQLLSEQMGIIILLPKVLWNCCSSKAYSIMFTHNKHPTEKPCFLSFLNITLNFDFFRSCIESQNLGHNSLTAPRTLSLSLICLEMFYPGKGWSVVQEGVWVSENVPMWALGESTKLFSGRLWIIQKIRANDIFGRLQWADCHSVQTVRWGARKQRGRLVFKRLNFQFAVRSSQQMRDL